jgi:hypothetical protein
MLYPAPEISAEDERVLAEIDVMRQELRHAIRGTPAKWTDGLRKFLTADAIAASNSIEGFKVIRPGKSVGHYACESEPPADGQLRIPTPQRSGWGYCMTSTVRASPKASGVQPSGRAQVEVGSGWDQTDSWVPSKERICVGSHRKWRFLIKSDAYLALASFR